MRRSGLALMGLVAVGAASIAAHSPLAAGQTRNTTPAHQAALSEDPASGSEGGFQLRSERHGLRTWLSPYGIRVVDRTASGSPVLLSLSQLGRGDALAPLPGGQLVRTDGRIEIRRAGYDLVEWFVDSRKGLEHGFTLGVRPPGPSAQPLVVELALTGARARAGADAVTLESVSGRRLEYGKLGVADADGRTLASRFELAGPNRIRIVVEDAGAAYPIVIDPLLTESADATIAEDWPASQIGASVASAGDVDGDGYDDVIVGAPRYGGGGAVLVLLGSATGVGTLGAIIQSSQADADLGASVAGAGDVNGDGYDDVIVGAPRYDAGQIDEGAAFVFLGGPTGISGGTEWMAAARLEADQTGAGVEGDLAPALGASVAPAGDVNGDGYDDVIVGAPAYDSGQVDEGAAFVFLGSPTGIPNGNPALAHARLESDQGGISTLDRWPSFGSSVAAAGDVNGDGYGDVIIGAPYYDAGQTDEGAAFVFLGSASGVLGGNPVTAHAQLESNQPGAGFGTSVAGDTDLDGNGCADVIIGAPGYTSGEPGEGVAFVFVGSGAGVVGGDPVTARAQLEADQTGSGGAGDAAPGLGASVAAAGDVNGDGYGDWIVGAPFYDGNGADSGAAFVFLGSSAYAGSKTTLGPDAAHARLVPGQGVSGLFSPQQGTSVAAAGDVNGDGLDDVIVGAPFFDTVFDVLPVEAGAAFVYLGSPTCGVAPPSPVAGLKHRYSFCEDASDSVGSAHGTVVDPGMIGHAFADGALDLSANTGQASGAITEDAYLDLPNWIASAASDTGVPGAVSFEVWFTVATSRPWQRVWDFGGGPFEEYNFGFDADFVALTPDSTRAGNGLELISHRAGVPGNPDTYVGAPGPFPTGIEQHVVAVLDRFDLSAGPNGTMRLYLNGAAVGTPAEIAPGLVLTLGLLLDWNNWLGRSQFTNDPVFDGSFDEFRIYDIALDAGAVAASYAAGPEFLPEPGGPLPLLLGVGVLVALQRRRLREARGVTGLQRPSPGRYQIGEV